MKSTFADAGLQRGAKLHFESIRYSHFFCNAVPVTEVTIKDKDSERGNIRKATNVSLDPLYALGNSGSQLEEEQIFSEIGGFFSTPETTNKIKCSVSKFDFLHFAQIWEGHVFD